ncbi:MAG: molecular chaperone TorD family protein [Gemmatimonadota bacterium]
MAEFAPTLGDAAAAGRANAHFALARALQPPRTWDEDLPHLVAGALGDLPEPLPALGEEMAAQIRSLLPELQPAEVAHAKLFIGPFEILAAPWACFYLEDEPRLMGPSSQYAAAAYAEAGLAPSEDLKDAPDHVIHELEFMYFLAFQQATTGERAWYDRRARFWREHLGRWLHRFADAVQQAAVHDFYRTLAEGLKALSVIEERELGSTGRGA